MPTPRYIGETPNSVKVVVVWGGSDLNEPDDLVPIQIPANAIITRMKWSMDDTALPRVLVAGAAAATPAYDRDELFTAPTDTAVEDLDVVVAIPVVNDSGNVQLHMQGTGTGRSGFFEMTYAPGSGQP